MHAMKAHREGRGKLHPFLHSALDGGGGVTVGLTPG